MLPPIWSCLLAAVVVADGIIVEDGVLAGVGEGVDAASECREVRPTPKPIASAITPSTIARTDQKTFRVKPQSLRLLDGFWKFRSPGPPSPFDCTNGACDISSDWLTSLTSSRTTSLSPSSTLLTNCLSFPLIGASSRPGCVKGSFAAKGRGCTFSGAMWLLEMRLWDASSSKEWYAILESRSRVAIDGAERVCQSKKTWTIHSTMLGPRGRYVQAKDLHGLYMR